MTKVDVAVIGAGPGGYELALETARRGLRTALIDRRGVLGGVCLNEGCIPSKALLESSLLYRRIIAESAAHGIAVAPPSLDLAALMARKDAVVKGLTDGIAVLMKARNVTVLRGEATVVAPASRPSALGVPR